MQRERQVTHLLQEQLNGINSSIKNSLDLI